MKEMPCHQGPFPVRLWFDEFEFEEVAEAALRRHELFPDDPGPINVELLVDLEFGFSYHFEDLPPGQLGKITFGENGPTEMVLNSKLDQPNRRSTNQVCRATLAHEIGHGLLHRRLFALLWQQYRAHERGESPFDESGASLRAGPGDSRWWEYQANRVMSPLLVPRDLLRLAVARTSLAGKPPYRWNKGDLMVLIEHISDCFNVGKTLAERRLKCIYHLKAAPLPIPRLICQPKNLLPFPSRRRPKRKNFA
jgi:hypothetical protein